ncbi:hypothetical protein LCGC14_1743340 [marine sediment metagenome]|uniref:DUF4911 domain-containing protein n=1 Tax=marine sediment metagenome TaxID=412755 RepID=A0A0F9H5Z4_9ZZZZ
MEISLKINIHKNQQFSLIIKRHPKIAGLLTSLTNVLKVGCNGVVIKDQDGHLQITSFEGAATLSILQTFIEVAYIKITGYNDAKEPEESSSRS